MFRGYKEKIFLREDGDRDKEKIRRGFFFARRERGIFVIPITEMRIDIPCGNRDED